MPPVPVQEPIICPNGNVIDAVPRCRLAATVGYREAKVTVDGEAKLCGKGLQTGTGSEGEGEGIVRKGSCAEVEHVWRTRDGGRRSGHTAGRCAECCSKE